MPTISFFGHEHKNYIFENKDKHYICVNSIGLNNPGEYYIITENNNKIEVSKHFLCHDLNKEKRLMDKAKYPYNKNKI